VKRNQNADLEQKKRRNRQAMKDVLQLIAKEQEKMLNLYTRQVDYDDLFDGVLQKGEVPGGITLLTPPYLPGRMYELYEQSAILKACVEAYVDNVDGYGYSIGSTAGEDDSVQKEGNPQVALLKEFFDAPNDKESFRVIREKLRRDFETTGNGYLEIIRGLDGTPVMAFWVDSKRVRLTSTRDAHTMTVTVTRGGKQISIPVEKRFRTYCMLSTGGSIDSARLRYFKEYGDPRQLDCTTGMFAKDGETIPPEKLASEIIHFKHGNDTYGIPRWIASLLSVMGSWKAGLVNYDLFDNQGIPPMIITVAGGKLTDDSFNDLLALLKKSKGVKNFNRLLILEVEGNGVSLDGKDAVPHLNIKSMTESRKEDAMFLNYLKNCTAEVQKLGFRLPGMFLGISDDANYATAFIVRRTAEEQIFIPERDRFDEIINQTLVKDLLKGKPELRFRSNGPVLKSVENLPQVLTLLVNTGVFTVNGLISFVNEQFGLNIALYDGKMDAWAEEPIKPGATATPPETSQADSRVSVEEVQKNMKIYSALKEIEKVADKFFSDKNCGCRAA
jgi:PBSX family phage portal protein